MMCRYVVHIPENLAMDAAAPLLCAGITVFNPLKDHDLVASPGKKIGVVGVEGDPLVDRERELVGLLQHKGVQVVGLFYQGGRHGIFVGDPSMSVKVFDLLKTLH